MCVPRAASSCRQRWTYDAAPITTYLPKPTTLIIDCGDCNAQPLRARRWHNPWTTSPAHPFRQAQTAGAPPPLRNGCARHHAGLDRLWPRQHDQRPASRNGDTTTRHSHAYNHAAIGHSHSYGCAAIRHGHACDRAAIRHGYTRYDAASPPDATAEGAAKPGARGDGDPDERSHQ